jgi:hypothetical protein
MDRQTEKVLGRRTDRKAAGKVAKAEVPLTIPAICMKNYVLLGELATPILLGDPICVSRVKTTL